MEKMCLIFGKSDVDLFCSPVRETYTSICYSIKILEIRNLKLQKVFVLYVVDFNVLREYPWWATSLLRQSSLFASVRGYTFSLHPVRRDSVPRASLLLLPRLFSESYFFDHFCILDSVFPVTDGQAARKGFCYSLRAFYSLANIILLCCRALELQENAQTRLNKHNSTETAQQQIQ